MINYESEVIFLFEFENNYIHYYYELNCFDSKEQELIKNIGLKTMEEFINEEEEKERIREEQKNKWKKFGIDWDVVLTISGGSLLLILMVFFLWKWFRSLT